MQACQPVVISTQQVTEKISLRDLNSQVENLNVDALDSKAAKHEALEQVFKKFRSLENTHGMYGSWLYAKILLPFAATIYEENFEQSREIVLGALSCLRHGKDLLVEHKTLFEMREFLKNNSEFFNTLEDEIKNWTESSALTILEDATKEQKLIFTSLLQRLLYCLQNIDSYDKLPYKKNDIFGILYSNLESIYRSMPDVEKAKKEFIELIYNSRPFIFLRECPNDFEKVCQIYDTVLELDNSDTMKARVANIRGCWLRRANLPEKAKDLFDEAIKLQSSIPDFNPFVQANTYSNRASTELVCKDPDLEMAKKFINVALEYSSLKRERNEDNEYFALYDMVAAKIELKDDNIEKARTHCKNAKESLDKYPESNEDDMKKLDDLERLISEREQQLH